MVHQRIGFSRENRPCQKCVILIRWIVVVFVVGNFIFVMIATRYATPTIRYNPNDNDELRNEFNPQHEMNISSDLAFPGYNGTHLWLYRLADEKYQIIASLLPCRKIDYGGGSKIESIDSCDHSSNNEYSVQNNVRAQKWIYEHQNPKDCSNKRFAIIEYYAISGYGSTIHQIAWALGVAIAENRIALYRKPGNWVRISSNDNHASFN